MIANAQRRDSSGPKQEDKEPEREDEPTAPIWLKKPQNDRDRLLMAAELLLVVVVGFGC